ncbi:hypothetical protein K1719_001960 [Acacia pycnantha]|nr:hypothetical protein K1719_001960 [Acacia pycnantha]
MQVCEVQNTPLFDSSSWTRIIGSCNGLLCVAINEVGIHPASILLWNPAVREFRQLPGTRTIDRFEWECTVGFGFSPLINDYKIVRTYAESGDVISGVEVYSLSTGSWKEIELGNLENVNLYLQTVSANGAIFWNGIKQGMERGAEDDTDLIVSFDIAMELFTLIQMPNSFSKLSVYDDQLAVLSHTRIGDFPNYLYSSIDVWVLEESIGASTERRSWTKKCTCSPCPCLLDLGVIWRNEIACVAFGMPRLNLDPKVDEDDIPIVLGSWQVQVVLAAAMHIKGSRSSHKCKCSGNHTVMTKLARSFSLVNLKSQRSVMQLLHGSVQLGLYFSTIFLQGHTTIQVWHSTAQWLHPAITSALRVESFLISDKMKHLFYEWLC